MDGIDVTKVTQLKNNPGSLFVLVKTQKSEYVTVTENKRVTVPFVQNFSSDIKSAGTYNPR
jgi:hypothetical protein